MTMIFSARPARRHAVPSAKSKGVLTFAALCRDLFLLAQDPLAEAGPGRGTAWENRVADHLTVRGLPVEAMPGGCRIFGHASLSGLNHQIDGTIACPDAL